MAAASLPTLPQVRAFTADYLDDAAMYWAHSADRWGDVVDTVYVQVQCPGGKAWTGAAADAASFRVSTDRHRVATAAGHLYTTARAAQRAAAELIATKGRILHAVAAAEDDGFVVGEDYSITSRQLAGSPADRAARQAHADALAADLRARVLTMVTTDEEAAAQISTAAAGLRGITFDPSGQQATFQAVDFRGSPIPEGPGSVDEPAPPPGGWSTDPLMRAAQKIAYGHAVAKHLAEDFPGMTSDQVAQRIYRLFQRASSGDTDGLVVGTSDGAAAIYDRATNMMVIRDSNPLKGDCGTVFTVKPRPDQTIEEYVHGKISGHAQRIPVGDLLDSRPWAPPGESTPIPVPGSAMPGASTEGSVSVPSATTPAWGTYVSPEEARDAGGEVGNLQRFIDAFRPPQAPTA